MDTDPNNQNESATVNGGDLTEEEAKLFAAGVDEPGDGEAGDDDTAATEAAATAAAEAATAAATAQAAAEVAAAASTVSTTQAAVVQIPDKPEPPKDFNAEIEALEKAYAEDGTIDAVELNRKTRELTLEEADYRASVRDWDRTRDAAEQTARATAENDWNATTVAFEADNKDFLSNPLRHKVMQDAINTVIASGEALDNKGILDKARAIALDYTGYQPPVVAVDETGKQKVGDALKERRPAPAPQTLGDAPTAANETFTGTEGFQALDALPIPDLEIAFANMSPSQQEKYLRESPGATANGHE